MKTSVNRPHRSMRRRSRTRLRIEHLESRNLLAGDASALEMLASESFADASHPSVRVSAGGRFYFLDPAESDDANSDAAPIQAAGEKIPLDALPQLSSDPNSSNTFYLDFTGQVVTGTDWNTTDYGGKDIHAIPYDLDGDLTTFSEQEVAAITEIWQRVSEDFLPFDINITTIEPRAAEFRRGRGAIRAIITTNIDDKESGGTGDEWFEGAGGVAYISSWLTPGDMPVWVFYNKLPNKVKAVAEAASHEFGHALGLSHDGGSGSAYYNGHGSGSAGWAPIMGAGYTKNVTQWSRGDYPGANNDERDLDIITNEFNRVGYRDDDHGNWEPDASPLERLENHVSGAGVISENTDIDFFSFDHPGGPLTLQITPAELGPNLDVVAGLYDDDRNELVVSEPASALDAHLAMELDAGTYYLFVEGGGYSPDSGPGFDDYGSLGQYSITGFLGTPSLTAHPGGNEDGSGCGCQGAGCTFCLGSSYVIHEGATLVLDGSRSVVPHGPVEYIWDVDGDGQFDDAEGKIVSLTWEELSTLDRPIRDDGEYSVRLQVRDEEGNSDQNGVTLTVLNRAPEGSLKTLPDVLYAGQPVALEVDVTDVLADPLTVAWDFGDGSPEQFGVDMVLTHVYDEGDYQLTAIVADDDGGELELSMDVRVRYDLPRVVGSSIPEQGAVIPPDVVRVDFSHDVSGSLNPSDLYLFDTTNNVVVNPIDPAVVWLADSKTAQFSIEGVERGEYLVVLNGFGIADPNGVQLDGDGDGDRGGNWSRAVKVTLGGDANLDWTVDFDDFLVVVNTFGQPSAKWEDGDFDRDGIVSFADFLVLATNFGG